MSLLTQLAHLATVALMAFTFTVNHGLTGTVNGLQVSTPQLKLFTGQLTSGNPLTAAVFRPCNDICANEFVSRNLHGNWDGDVMWQKVGNTTSYTITGSVQGVAVVVTCNNVVFTADGGWNN